MHTSVLRLLAAIAASPRDHTGTLDGPRTGLWRQHAEHAPDGRRWRLRRWWFGALVSLAAVAAAAGTPAVVIDTSGRVQLALQQVAVQKSPELSIHFSGYRDQRCPADVRCAWAGEAQAFFWVMGQGIQPQLLALPWSGSGLHDRNARRLGMFRLALVSLEPRPLMNGEVNPADYTAVLAVEVLPASPAR